jgi:hypothetical protein
MTNHRRTKRRSQKGGFLEYFGLGSSQPADPNAPGMFSWLSSKTKEAGNSLNTTIGNVATTGMNSVSGAASSVMDVVSSPFSSSSGNTSPTGMEASPIGQPSGIQANPTGMEPNQQGGRRRKRARSMKGGKGGLGLTYYAAPVDGLKVAEPTTWQYYANGTNQYSVKGGSRKRRNSKRKPRKSRRTRRHRRC